MCFCRCHLKKMELLLRFTIFFRFIVFTNSFEAIYVPVIYAYLCTYLKLNIHSGGFSAWLMALLLHRAFGDSFFQALHCTQETSYKKHTASWFSILVDQ